jgi:hypothetical protein
MRGRNSKRRETAKHGRRFVLAGLIVASGQFAEAEMPVAMVPLPLTPLGNEITDVRINPFCQPVIVEVAETNPRHFLEPVAVAPLHVAAGAGKVEKNHLPLGVHPDGRTVVLTSGDGSQQTSSAGDGREGLRAYLQGSPVNVAGGVRANPLASRFDAAEPKVDAIGVRALAGGVSRTSGISFSLPAEEAAIAVEIEQASGKPVVLSLSDDAAADAGGDFADGSGQDSGISRARQTTRPATPWHTPGVERSATGLPQPVNLRTLEPRQFAAGRILQVPVPESVPESTNSAAVEMVTQSDPVDPMAVSSDEGRLVNGGRPRVEVGLPPVSVDRLASSSIVPGKPRLLLVDQQDPVDSQTDETIPGDDVQRAIAVEDSLETSPPVAASAKTLQSIVESSEQREAAPVVASAAVPASVYPVQNQAPETIVSRFVLRPTEVRAIAIDSPVAHVQSDNMAVCAVLKAAPGQVQVIATGGGTTRLSVHTVGQDGVEKIDRYEVAVGEVRASTVDSPESMAMTLTQTVQSAFPGSNVLVSAEAGRIVVIGSCSDEDAARRMLRMIRSACAIPVVDRVKVR